MRTLPELKKIYSYLGNLEKKIKLALTVFVLLLFSGSFIIGVGVDRLSHLAESTKPEYLLLVGLGVLATILTLMLSVSRTSWIEELHIKIDNNIFGFLKRTNDTIFGSLLFALAPEERKSASKLDSRKQSAVVQSIFSTLSNDTGLFENFLRTKIFRNWTLYWIMVYGTLTYTLLTVVSFIFVALGFDPYAKLLFTICWLLSGIHLAIVILLGRRLVIISKEAVDSMVQSHKNQIAKVLRENIGEEEEEIEEADVIPEE